MPSSGVSEDGYSVLTHNKYKNLLKNVSIKNFFIRAGVSLHICLCMVHIPDAQGGQGAVQFLRTGVTDGCELPYGCWELGRVLW